MRGMAILVAALIGCAGGTALGSGLTGEEAPEAVRAAVLQLVGPHELEELEAEQDDGVIVWEAAWHADEVQHEADLLADGTVLEHEFEVSPEQVPAGVRSAAESLLGGGPLEYQLVQLTLYEVSAEAGAGSREVLLLASGELVADDLDDEDDDDDDDDDD